MTTLYEVPPNALIKSLAERIRGEGKVKPPEWAPDVKTGNHSQFTPVNEDWWYTRCAAILRKVAISGPVGVNRLRTAYGGSKNRGSKPNRFRKGSGSIAREALQQLEIAGLIARGVRGRTVTPAGQALLDAVAHEIATSSVKA